MDRDTFPLRNRYVVFVDTSALSPPDNYEWNFEFYGEDPANPFFSRVRTTRVGVFDFDVYDLLPFKYRDKIITRVNVRVRPSDSEELRLSQPVVEIDRDIELLFTGTEAERYARGGDPLVTRKIANRYRGIITSTKPDDPHEFSNNALAAKMYAHASWGTDELLDFQAEAWENYINKVGSEIGDVPRFPLGICQLSPYVISMFLDGVHNPSPLTSALTWDPKEEPYEQFAAQAIEQFHDEDNVSLDDKIDLINLLRFPKSAVQVAKTLLSQLLLVHPDWGELEQSELETEREAVEKIFLEAELGLVSADAEPTRSARTVFQIMFAPYIQAIVGSLDEHMLIVDDVGHIVAPYLGVTNWKGKVRDEDVDPFDNVSQRNNLYGITGIVLHETDGRPEWTLKEYQLLNQAGKSIHAYIDFDGRIVQHEDLARVQTGHTGANGYNPATVGFEILAPVGREPKKYWTSEVRLFYQYSRIAIAWDLLDGEYGALDGEYSVPPIRQMEAVARLVYWLTGDTSPVSGVWESIHQAATRRGAEGDPVGLRWPGYNPDDKSMRIVASTDSDLHGEPKVGIFAHAQIQENRLDGVFPLVYCWLRIEGGMMASTAYAKAKELLGDTSSPSPLLLNETTVDLSLDGLDGGGPAPDLPKITQSIYEQND